MSANLKKKMWKNVFNSANNYLNSNTETRKEKVQKFFAQLRNLWPVQTKIYFC